MKNVMLLGDSSRINYENYVREKLPGVNIETPPENCRFSAYMLNSLRFWLPQMSKPDLIHFNCGSWDTAILYADDGPFTPLDEYVRNMNSIVRELKKFNVPVVYATSAPVKAEQIKAVAVASVKATAETPTVFKQNNDRIRQYNEAVVEEFRKQGVIINDMWELIYPHLDKYISEDGIHMNEKGVAVMGDAVVKIIKRYL